MKFLSRAVKVIKRTKSVKSIRFEKPEHFSYLPGQWTFLIFGDGPERIMKPLSFSSSPTEDHLEVTKKLTGLRFSELVDDLEVGDTLAQHDQILYRKENKHGYIPPLFQPQ
jgi:ferredoxin-NADP reductase